MQDGLRSLLILAAAFVGPIVITLGLATAIVPDATTGVTVPSAGPSATPIASAVAAPRQPGEIGGTITISGDREGSFTLRRESTDGRYALVGNGGRLYFEGEPITVAQLSFDGLEFFLEPDDCTITAGDRNAETGVAEAHLACVGIEDVRGAATVDLDGVIGVAADLVGLRGDLPPLGGTIAVGDRTYTFEEPALLHPRFTSTVGQLYDVDEAVLFVVGYDAQTHAHELEELVVIGGAPTRFAPEDCDLATTEIGVVNPHTRQLELTVACPAVDVAGLGTVDIAGRLMVEEVELLP